MLVHTDLIRRTAIQLTLQFYTYFMNTQYCFQYGVCHLTVVSDSILEKLGFLMDQSIKGSIRYGEVLLFPLKRQFDHNFHVNQQLT